ncbi:MAG: ABC transporter ATP-binding protein [Fibrobacter sp.]|jgi:lipoprotein-releasing system ATP-binding protein|nr:ABC transporter ATP-binding protein [Fibrobacter sp.]
MSEILLETQALTKVYEETGERLEILRGVDIQIAPGDFTVLTGASGSGKSTLLNLMGLLDQPTSGEILFKGKSLRAFSDRERDDYHMKSVGFVFQFHHLLSEFTAIENVATPARILKYSKPVWKERAEMLLETVGLKDRRNHLPRELSGGERQRVAVARALMNQPDLVFADEPSGNLDEKNAVVLNELFVELNKKYGQSFLIVTHDERMAREATKRFHMRGGLVVPFNEENAV